jgi:hypothetical protein
VFYDHVMILVQAVGYDAHSCEVCFREKYSHGGTGPPGPSCTVRKKFHKQEIIPLIDNDYINPNNYCNLTITIYASSQDRPFLVKTFEFVLEEPKLITTKSGLTGVMLESIIITLLDGDVLAEFE